MNRLHALDSSVRPWISRVAARWALTALCLTALCLLLPAAASAQVIDPDPPDPDPGPFCLTRSTTGLDIPGIIALQGATLDRVNWTRNGNTFTVTVKLRQEHRYAGSDESCLYDDGLWTSYGRSINVHPSTPQLFLRTTPTTTLATVTVMDPTYPTRFAVNVRYQENVGAFTMNFFPKRKKRVCIDLPRADGDVAGDALVRSCS